MVFSLDTSLSHLSAQIEHKHKCLVPVKYSLHNVSISKSSVVLVSSFPISS